MSGRAVVGIDPGATGAAAMLDLTSSILELFDDPGGKVIAAHARAEWLREALSGYDPQMVTVAIEEPPRAWRRPNAEAEDQTYNASTSSIAKLAQNAGVWEGIVATLGYSYSYVAAITWKSAMGLVKHPKADSLIVARREFPWASTYFLRKTRDVGRADATLIALFAARRLQLQ